MCEIQYCTGKTKSLNLCRKHYERLRLFGSTQPRTTSPYDRFWPKVDKHSDPNGCWLWTAVKTAHGYGQLTMDGRPAYAHRLAWAWANMCPMPPSRLKVDHMCYNPPCVNPEHLRLGTQKQNNENKQGLSKANTSGYRGVHLHKLSGLWVAKVGDSGVSHHLGYFKDVHGAGEAARLKRIELFSFNDLDQNRARA